MSNNNTPPPAEGSALKKLIALIAIYFLVEALCDPEGLIYQSMILLLKDVHGWSESQVNNVFSAMSIPLLARPLYGIICDSLPLFGYKRKTYLAGFMVFNMVGYAAIAFLNTPSYIVIAMFVVAVGVSGGATVATAVIVENGNKYGKSSSLINTQWFWFNLGVLAFALAGGWLARHFSVLTAYQVAAIIAAIGPALVVAAVWYLLDEPRSQGLDVKALKDSLGKLKAVLTSRLIWMTSGFIVVYNIAPMMKIPLIYHLVDHLHFSADFIGILIAVGAIGAMCGSFVFKQLEARLTLKKLLYLGVALSVISKLSYLLLGTSETALAIWAFNGVLSIIILIPCLSLAALRCPEGLEAFGYGTMTCFLTLSRTAGSWLGGWIYEHLFASSITPLILVSAALAVLPLLLVPFLKLSDGPAKPKS